jgi:RNA polymerase sigma factor (sigma-70 family)
MTHTLDAPAALESVFRLLIRLAGQRAKRGGLDRDDLFGEACVIFLACFDRYDPARGSLANWAAMCCWSAYARLMRQRQRSRRDGATDAEIIEQLHGRESDPAAAMLDSEAVAGLHAAVEILPPRERLLVRARYGLDDGTERTVEAASAVAGAAPAYARQMHRRALQRLETSLRGIT